MLRSARSLIFTVILAAACAPVGTAASGGGAAPSPAAPDPSSATYRIDKDTVTLANGRAEREAAPGSASKVVTTLTDKRATGDIDGDGRPDAVVVLTYQPGGSGSFSYVAALLGTSGGVTVTPAVLLGDRVAVTGVRLDGATIVVEMLDRASGQPLTASPSVATTRRYAVDRGTLVAR